ncbi:hypothetical protein F2Q68_00033245 [Brassica cretica]|uniref:Uncharacterized protein n=2 Tax=Brassica cretica TaxID=69181 RepID=A0ABQ7B247_BRACR|nr:hypothetical protein F2Q68_00033245 [Brassica cretica]KAF3520352.1 hypothetical protein DY000_02063493 [Brassica cretica]
MYDVGGEQRRLRHGLRWYKEVRRSGEQSFERIPRSRAVGDGEDTKPVTESDEKTGTKQSRANDGEEDPTPAARGLTGVETDNARLCFGNRD